MPNEQITVNDVNNPVNKGNNVDNILTVTSDPDENVDEELINLIEIQIDEESTDSLEAAPCPCHGFLLGNCPTRIQQVLQISQDVVKSGMPNRDMKQIAVGSLNIIKWKEQLKNYDDSDDVLKGLEFGWELGRVGETPLVSASRNHKSADDNSESVEEYIKDELAS